MNALAKYFKDSKYMNLLVYDKELLKNKMQYGIKLVVYLKKYLIVNQCIKINAWTFVLLLDSLVSVSKKCYPIVYSNQCKYIKKR